jgi:hypothetical protein
MIAGASSSFTQDHCVNPTRTIKTTNFFITFLKQFFFSQIDNDLL